MQLPEHMRRLDALAAGFQKSALLFTALNHGVFEHLQHWASVEDVAQAVGWEPRATRIMLDALLALELVDKSGKRYQNAEVAAQCLVPGAPMDQTHILKHKAGSWESYTHMDQVLERGHPLERGPRTGEDLEAFIMGMHDIAQESARAMTEAVDFSEYTHLLDVGGGPGSYSHALLRACPGMKATLLDLPEVLHISRRVAGEAGLEDRMDFIEGDMLAADFGEGYDLVMVSNIIHSWSYRQNAALVAKCHAALAPGGMLVIKDFLLDDGRTGPAFGLLFAVHMLLHTQGGDCYTRREVEEWCTAAGFTSGEFQDLTPQSRLWLARK